MKRLLVLLGLAMGALLVLAPIALAQTVRVDDGVTRLKVDAGTAAALGDAGVSVESVGATGGAGRQFVFPITGGRVDTDPLRGQIRHSGGLVFVTDDAQLVLRRFIIDLDEGVLTARVPAADARVPILKLKGGRADLDGPVVGLSDVRATLTPEAAGALNATFDTNLFKRGLPIGEANTKTTVVN